MVIEINELFLPADSRNEARLIDYKNVASAARIKRDRVQCILNNGTVSEANLPDVKQIFDAERQKCAQEAATRRSPWEGKQERFLDPLVAEKLELRYIEDGRFWLVKLNGVNIEGVLKVDVSMEATTTKPTIYFTAHGQFENEIYVQEIKVSSFYIRAGRLKMSNIGTFRLELDRVKMRGVTSIKLCATVQGRPEVDVKYRLESCFS